MLNAAVLGLFVAGSLFQHTSAVVVGCEKGADRKTSYNDGSTKQGSVLAVNLTKTVSATKDQVCVFNLCNRFNLTIDKLSINSKQGLACQDGGAGHHPFFFTLYYVQGMSFSAEIWVTFMFNKLEINKPTSFICTDTREQMDDYCN